MRLRLVLLAVIVAATIPMVASAASIIDNGTIKLGVDDLGQLNISGGSLSVGTAATSVVGLRRMETGGEYESTAQGCLCEGWGAGADGVGGFANNAFGTANLTLFSFTSTASTATSIVDLTTGGLRVTHEFAPSGSTPDLYRVSVTIENTSAVAITDLRYRRVMDWDADPTPFSEYVSIGGTATTSLLLASSDNGFASSDPYGFGVDDLAGCGITSDFDTCGPDDHGALFDFGFGALAVGESYAFDIFYGAASSETAAFSALGAVGAELYSFGRSELDLDGDGFSLSGGLTPTYIFAFAGVGGTAIVPLPEPTPSVVPLPASGLLLFGALGALGLYRRKRHA